MKRNNLFLATVALSSSSYAMDVPHVLQPGLASDGYAFDRGSYVTDGGTEFWTAKPTAALVTVRWGIAGLPSHDPSGAFREPLLPSNADLRITDGTTSGYPIGDEAIMLPAGSRTRVTLHVRWGLNAASTYWVGRTPRTPPTAIEESLAEGCLRWTVAHLGGADTAASAGRQIAGSNVRCRRGADGTVLADLKDWASARGVQLVENAREARYAFERSGKLTVVPLGAKGFKSGPSWWSYAEPTCAVDGRPYVPLDALESRT